MKRSLLTSLAAVGGNVGPWSSSTSNSCLFASKGAAPVSTMASNRESAPRLAGVVFDMDGTLTKPNLDFGKMYDRCGVDRSRDILEEVAAMPADQRDRANAIIEEMEEEGRQTLELMPGAKELIQWLEMHGIPMALVTRNTQKSASVLTDRLLASTQSSASLSTPASPMTAFHPLIARDDGYPPKPDPAAMNAIAEAWGLSLPSESILMVGDSVSNDIAFGRNAGCRTALLDTGRRYEEESAGKESGATPDYVVDVLHALPCRLWREFEIPGPLGSMEAPGGGMQKFGAPEPSSALTTAAAEGDLKRVTTLLKEEGEGAIHLPDQSGNTALIWAAEKNHAEVVDCLLSLNTTSLDHRGYLGATAVSRAARRGHCGVLKKLVEARADLDIPNDKMQYPLHFAAFKQHQAAVEVLLDGGANPRVLDRKGRTPAEDTSDDAIREVLQAALSKE